MRLNRQALPLFDAAGQRIDPLQLFAKIKAGQPAQWVTRVRRRNGDWIVGRLIAIRRSAAATRQVRKKLKRRANRRREKLTRESWRAAQYLAVWTTLGPDFSVEQILEFYRLRWQIELAFKRMKSLLGLGHLPKKDPASARAWLHGKLFASLLVERMIEAASSISPWGYELEPPAQPVERN